MDEDWLRSQERPRQRRQGPVEVGRVRLLHQLLDVAEYDGGEADADLALDDGWPLADVPAQAISMSVRQILSAAEIVAVVPDRRKAEAVRNCVEGPVSPLAPASILRTHAHTTLYLDAESASLLRPESRGALRD